MKKNTTPNKHLTISKDTKQILIFLSIGVFVVVFCVVAINYFLNIRSFQNKIVAADNSAKNQLNKDINSANSLVNTYNKFVSSSPIVSYKPIIIGKTSSNSSLGKFKYNNATIVLDALPTQYDYPALISYLQELISSINQSSDSINVSNQASSTPSSNSTSAVPINFSISANGISYASYLSLVQTLANSVRPININSLSLNGSSSALQVTINAQTYYQPSIKFSVSNEVIK